jgi:hypothetical protein
MRKLTDEEILNLYKELLDHIYICHRYLTILVDADKRKFDLGSEGEEFRRSIKCHEAMAERIRQQINSGYAEPEQGELPK